MNKITLKLRSFNTEYAKLQQQQQKSVHYYTKKAATIYVYKV